MAQAAEPPHVDHVAHGVHHAARSEEQQSLEESMREQVKHGRDHGELPNVTDSGPQRHEHVTELADCRISQHALQVCLGHGDRRRQQGGRTPDRRNQQQHFRRQ